MRILAKFLARFHKNDLSSILKDPSIKEMMLGFDRKAPRTDGLIESNAARVINYSKTEGYDVFARELWDTAVSYLNILTDPHTPKDNVDFYRGCLSATLDDLKISYKAFLYLEGQRKKTKIPLNGSLATSTRN